MKISPKKFIKIYKVVAIALTIIFVIVAVIIIILDISLIFLIPNIVIMFLATILPPLLASWRCKFCHRDFGLTIDPNFINLCPYCKKPIK
ncbi:MAG: hypothetical protein FWC69_05830 [Defluviitaleaceae bacterium]|nr:hypothetical protein [Defluviitaleaceae bacterium]